MPKKPDAYLRPKNLDEALRLLAQPDHIALAGGAHLLATEEGVSAAAVVDLQDCDLGDVATTDGELTAGATVRLSDLAAFLNGADLPGDLPRLLQAAIRQAGPNTYRHAATLGGVIASRLPDSELLAALLVAEATLDLHLPQPERVTLVSYLAAPARPAGLISAVHLPLGLGRWAAERVARTPADYPIVSVTAWLPDAATTRLAITGNAERPWRPAAVEAAMVGGLSGPSIAAAADAAAAATTHPGDFRGDTAYRAEMAAVLTRRVLRQLADA
jgi:carbon-monoxide dehydrogenase medium subunit